MKLKVIIFSILLLFASYFSSCFPTYQAVNIDKDTVAAGDYYDIQAKVFLDNNTIVLFPAGYTVSDSFISGDARIFEFNSESAVTDYYRIPLDSITAMINYEETTNGFRYFGSFLLGCTGPPLVAMAVYCLMCPKCCFGSCPTIYLFDGKNYNLESELFSECISRQLENNDLDVLNKPITDGTLNLKITNEALETHYINKFEVLVAEHPVGTKVLSSPKKELILINEVLSPVSVINKDGNNITNIVNEDDENYYRSGVEKVSALKNGPEFEYIDIKAAASKGSPLKIILKYRNTLLSTALLYDVVIGSQGIKGMEWTKKMNEDADYAFQFKMVYDLFSGIKIKIFNGSSWENMGKFEDAGPLNWKYAAAELPIVNSDTVLIRLEFIPDNFILDYIAIDTTQSGPVEIKIVEPAEVTDAYGNPANDALEYINKDDTDYLKTEPGDSYTLIYNFPVKKNFSQTAFIKSKGYYNEWIRGNWIKNKSDNYSFSLYDIKGTLARLAESWFENHEILEREFFHSRFMLKEAK